MDLYFSVIKYRIYPIIPALFLILFPSYYSKNYSSIMCACLWPGLDLLLLVAFSQRCQTTRVHFMASVDINKTGCRCRRIMCPREFVSGGHIGLGYSVLPDKFTKPGISVRPDRKSCPSRSRKMCPAFALALNKLLTGGFSL